MARQKSNLKQTSSNKSEIDHINAVSDVLFYSIGEGAIIIDERGNISKVNKMALEILGFKAKELLGKWYPNTLIIEDEKGDPIPNIERPVMEVFLTGKPVFKKAYFRRKDNTRVAVALTVSPVIYQDRPVGAIEIFREITKEVQLENAKDEFISIASHQLRTPATVVKQYLGMILEGYVESKDQQMEMIKLAYEHNNNQLDIINDLLKVAQVEANKIVAKRENIDIVELLQKVIESQRPAFENRRMHISLVAKEPTILCKLDRLQIQMVFENLISNAYKYSPDVSRVVVNITQESTFVQVDVKDQGMGIAEEDIPKLFKKFSRAANAHSTVSGTGLGLYWAKQLVELHGGEISLTSKLGKGTTLSVKLPKEMTL